MFSFKIRATEKDPTGYYHPRWDLAQKLTVTGNNRDEAFSKAKAVLGEVGDRQGWPWVMTIDDIQEI